MVVLVGAVAEPLLAGLARSSNVSLVRPPEEEKDPLTAAALALGQAAGRASPYVVVPADPLAGVAAEWAAMWDLTAGPGHAAAFEERAAAAVAAWRAGRFELPDYYVALTPGGRPGGRSGPGCRPGQAAAPACTWGRSGPPGPRRVGAVVTPAREHRAGTPGPPHPPARALVAAAGRAARPGAALLRGQPGRERPDQRITTFRIQTARHE